MSEKYCVPKTYLNHPNQWKWKAMLERFFIDPDPNHITEELKGETFE